MIAYLVSAQQGDLVPGGVATALVDVPELREGAVQEWMAAQGFGAEDEGECMYLSPWPAPEGFPARRVRLSPASAAWFRSALAGRLREYAKISSSRDELVAACAAAGLSKRKISVLSGISRQTVYNILEGRG